MSVVFHWLRSGAAFLGVVLLAVTLTPVTRWWAAALAGPRDDPAGRTLVLLGGALLDPGLAGPNSYWRATYAGLIWRQGGFDQVIIAGSGPDGAPVSEPMRDMLVTMGVPASRILIETGSRSTLENALALKPLLASAPHPWVLVTSDLHMYRAIRVFQKQGLSVLPRPAPEALKLSNCYTCRWGTFLDLAAETSKILYYRLRGWI